MQQPESSRQMLHTQHTQSIRLELMSEATTKHRNCCISKPTDESRPCCCSTSSKASRPCHCLLVQVRVCLLACRQCRHPLLLQPLLLQPCLHWGSWRLLMAHVQHHSGHLQQQHATIAVSNCSEPRCVSYSVDTSTSSLWQGPKTLLCHTNML